MNDPTQQYTDGSYSLKVPDWHEGDSEWKADQILSILSRNDLQPRSILDVGCGAGGILARLKQRLEPGTRFVGYDVAPRAVEMARKHADESCVFHVGDALTDESGQFDLALAIDVFEHIPDYMGFLSRLGTKAPWTAFHIPLDMFALGVFLDHPAKTRALHGHLHYFSKNSALSSLEDSGYKVVDWFYTRFGWERPVHGGHLLLKYPRRCLFALVPDASVRLLGGCSLMVLAKYTQS